MQQFLTGEPEGFVVPEGIVTYTIDPLTGLLTKDETFGIIEYFKEGTEPSQFTPGILMRRARDTRANHNYD